MARNDNEMLCYYYIVYTSSYLNKTQCELTDEQFNKWYAWVDIQEQEYYHY